MTEKHARNTRTADAFGITDVAEVVKDIYEIEIDHMVGNEAYFKCVAHDDHTPSASINLVSGYWSCWSCAAGGDIINLGAYNFKAGRAKVMNMLVSDDPDRKRAQIIKRCKALKDRANIIRQLEAQGFKDRVHDFSEFTHGPMAYMFRRNFTEETLEYFQVMYGAVVPVKTKTGKDWEIKDVICIPVYDAEGVIVGWCFRSTTLSPEKQPRYFYTTGLDLKPLLFAEYHSQNQDEIVVTEGPLDAMYLWQEVQPAVAVFGAAGATSEEKIEKLSNFKRVIIFGDRDVAGSRFAAKLGDLLSPHTSVSVVRYLREWEGKDPNSLTADQARQAVARAIPFHNWQAKASKS